MSASLRRWLRLLLHEATSGVTLFAGLAVTVVSLTVALLTDTSEVSANLSGPLNLALTASAFLGPVAAGGAAVRTGLLTRQGVLALASTTGRGRPAVLVLTTIALVLWAVLAYLVFVAVVLITIPRGGPATPAMMVLTAQALAFLVLAVVLGVAAGSLVPHSLVGPVVAIGIFATVAVLDLATGPFGRLSPIFADVFYRYRFEPNAALVIALVIMMAGAVLVVVALTYRLTRRLAVLTGACGLVVVLLGAYTMSQAPSGDVLLRSGSIGQCTTRDGIELCVWPGPGVPVQASISALAHARAVADRIFPVPNRFHEPGLDPAGDALEFDVPGPDQVGLPRYAAWIAVIRPPCDEASRRAAEDLTGLVGELLNSGTVDPAGPLAAGIGQATRPLAEQRAWAAPRAAELRACE